MGEKGNRSASRCSFPDINSTSLFWKCFSKNAPTGSSKVSAPAARYIHNTITPHRTKNTNNRRIDVDGSAEYPCPCSLPAASTGRRRSVGVLAIEAEESFSLFSYLSHHVFDILLVAAPTILVPPHLTAGICTTDERFIQLGDYHALGNASKVGKQASA